MIHNFTPHPVNIITGSTFDPSIRKYIADASTDPATVIPSSGMLSARLETVEAEAINDIPVFMKRVVGCDPLPDSVGDDDIIVVSALYVSAYRSVYGNTERLFTIADPVYTPDGKTILGCRGICPAF